MVAKKSVDDYQIDGLHYRSSYQHWTLVQRTGMGYLEGCATKYVARWRKKAGLVDLEKAVHYTEKRLETAHFVHQPRRLILHPAAIQGEVHAFALANQLTKLEEDIIAALADWQYVLHLTDIPRMIHQLMATAGDPHRPVPEAAPVPATEENHYAPRVDQSEEE